MTRAAPFVVIVTAALVALWSAPAWAQTSPSTGEGDRPLAIPADTPVPQPRPPGTDRLPPATGDIEYRASQYAPKLGETSERQTRFTHVDFGYRLQLSRDGLMPIRLGGAWGDRAHLVHGSFGGMFEKNIYIGGAFEYTLNRAAGTLPMVLEVRGGWWDSLLGEPKRRGGVGMMQGVAVTYVGARMVHDHYRGIGQEWAGTGHAGGLVLGYFRAAPFGKFTVLSDSQISVYLLGWKDRGDFPLGLINQRISIGFDPIFLDARFRVDPALGQEWSIGMSFQAIF
jgi:hypothetical protein